MYDHYDQTEDEWLEDNGYERATLESLTLEDYVGAFDNSDAYAYVVDKDESDPPLWVDLEWHCTYNSSEPFETHVSRCYNTELLYKAIDDE